MRKLIFCFVEVENFEQKYKKKSRHFAKSGIFYA